MQESGDLSHHKEFQQHFPAVELPSKQYSLEPDVATGWRPRNRILGPVPLNFDSPLQDEIVDELTSFGSRYKERVIYLGYRYGSSFKLHQEMRRQYPFKHEAATSSNYAHMSAYFRKFHSNFKSKTSTRIFKGMNPTLKPETELIFDSNFESGNLDTVIKVGENEYDLFARIDSNTRGHLQWFNFTVKNCGKKRVKFNIVNFRKAKTMYQRGMKPYIYSEHLRQTKDVGWSQGGQNVKYSRRILGYQFLKEHYDEADITYNSLQFQYVFETDWEEAQFAYSPPYTFTDLTNTLADLKQVALQQKALHQESFLKQEVLCESLGGLQLPIVTITDPAVDNKYKRCILVSGRIHPGQPCGSYMGKGLMEYLCGESEQVKLLRRNLVFKIIPMINPDGVVAGNFRTSLCGRDLNRCFKFVNDLLIPQVRAVKELVSKLKSQYRSRLVMFLDLHGHSIKKNVFLYGPQYDIWETNYYRTRIFPKIISSKTEMFRYYSCLFRVAQFKKATGRAVLLRQIPHCYTVEASTGFYYSKEQKKDLQFTPQSWTQMGRKLGESLKDYMQMLNEEAVNREERKQRLISIKNLKGTRVQSKKNSDKLSLNKLQARQPASQTKGVRVTEDTNQKKEEFLSSKVRELIEQIKEDDRRLEVKDGVEANESDGYSEGGSDSEDAEDDLPEDQMEQFQNKMKSFFDEFREKFYREKSNRQFSLKETSHKKEEKASKKSSKGMQIIASLRRKAEELEKAKQVNAWNKSKESFGKFDSQNPRVTLSRIEAPRRRRLEEHQREMEICLDGWGHRASNFH